MERPFPFHSVKRVEHVRASIVSVGVRGPAVRAGATWVNVALRDGVAPQVGQAWTVVSSSSFPVGTRTSIRLPAAK